MPAPLTQDPTANAPPGMFDNIPGSNLDLAKQYVEKFIQLTGAPGYLKDQWPQIVAWLATDWDYVTGREKTYEWGGHENVWGWLWRFLNVSDMHRLEGTRYGMAQSDYEAALEKLQATVQQWTGYSGTLPGNLIEQAMKHSWSATDVQHWLLQGGVHLGFTGSLASSDYAIYGRFQGDLRQWFLDNAPWLAAGQSYQQTLQGYYAATGQAPDADSGSAPGTVQMPVSAQAVAAWYRFGQGGARLAASAGTSEVAEPGAQRRPPARSEVR